MIFVLHYILFNAGLSACIILIALFLQTYSEASLSEIGSLLMILPFVSIFVKPLFCALADRQQAHRWYMIGALFFTAAGYGSLAIAPFFPRFIKEHGRLVWYLDVIGVVIGYSAFGVVWSLGDALSMNSARKKGIAWGSYRVWGTVSWGVFGFLIGLINETPLLPRYVPALLVMVVAVMIEIVLWALWPQSAFDMNDPELTMPAEGDELKAMDQSEKAANGHQQQQQHMNDPSFDINETWSANKSLGGTIGGSTRLNPRLVSALAGMMMEDLGSTLKSSLRSNANRSGGSRQRTALTEVLEQHGITGGANPRVVALAARSPLLSRVSLAGAADLSQRPSDDLSCAASDSQSRSGTLGRVALRRANMVLSRMNSLGPIACDYPPSAGSAKNQNQSQNQNQNQTDRLDNSAQLMSSTPQVPRLNYNQKQQTQITMMTTMASANSIESTKRQNTLLTGKLEEGLKMQASPQLSQNGNGNGNGNGSVRIKKLADALDAESLCTIEQEVEKYVDDLQMILLKLIVRRDRSIIKFLIAFTVFGFLMSVHISYFFMHVEQICRQKGQDFSQVMGALVVAQSISEILSFVLVVRYYMPRVGRVGSLLTCAVLFGVRYVYYGTYYPEMSAYNAMATETMHGLAYGIIYTLITDCACDCVEELDEYLPELIARGIVDPSISANQLKLPLRATMQGVFSGAFDGLGFGLGALFGGLFLDGFANYVLLWQVGAGISALTFVYILLAHRGSNSN